MGMRLSQRQAGGGNPDGLSLDLAFALDKTLTARKGPTPTFSRASGGTFVNANGIIVGKTAGTTTSITPSTTAIGSQVTVTVASGSVVGWVVGQAISLIVDTDADDQPDSNELWLLGNIVSTTLTTLTFEVTSPTTQSGAATSWTLGYRGARFDHNPASPSVCRGLLIEESRENRNLRSEELDNNYYSKYQCNVRENVGVSPNGLTNADKIVENASNDFHSVFLGGISLTAGQTATRSVFAKPNGRNFVSLQLQDGATTYRAFFNIQSGTVGTVSSGITALITNAGNGWWRCSITRVYQGTTSGPLGIEIALADNVGSYQGDGTSGILAWGAQFEIGSFPTSYIPTTTAPLTRSADVCSITAAAFTSFYNNSAGTLLSEAMVANLVGNNRGIVQIDSGTNESHLRHGYAILNGGFFGSIRASADTQTTLSVVAGTASTIQKRAIAYEGTSFASTSNGEVVATTTRTMPVGLNAMRIGDLTSGSFQLNGHIARIQYFKKRLPNAKLQTLTTP